MKLRTYFTSIILVAAISGLLSCGKKTTESKSNPVVVEYGKNQLTKSNLLEYVRARHRMEKRRFYFGREGYIRAAKDYILQSYFAEEAKKNNFQAKNLDLYVEASLRPVMIRVMLDQATNSVTVGEKEVKEYYDSHPTDFVNPETVRFRHIFLEVPPDATPTQKKDIRKKIELLRTRILKGEDFITLAKEYSEVPSKENGGDAGYIVRGQIKVKSVEDTVFSLETGKISPVVETKYGFHIIKVEDKKPQSVRSFDEVKKRGVLQPLLLERNQQIAQSKFIQEVISRSSVERYYDRIPKFAILPPETTIFKIATTTFSIANFRQIFVQRLGVKENQPMSRELMTAIQQQLEELVADECLYHETQRTKFADKPEMQRAKKFIKEYILSEMYQNAVLDSGKMITPDVIKKFYEANLGRYKTQEQIIARQIFIAANITPEMTVADKHQAFALAKKKIETIRQAIINGADFAVVAKKGSQDQYASSGGYIGPIEYGQGGPMFDINAFKLSSGQMSQPIQMKDGYILIKVEKKFPARQKPFDEVKDTIKQYLTLENLNKLRAELLSKLINDKKAIVYEDKITFNQ